MIEPLQSDDALLADIVSRKSDGGFRLWWLGQSGYLLQWSGRHFLIDPYLSESLTKKYAQTDKPHVRMTRRAIDPARLDFIDVVSSSHNHTDHLDAETLVPLLHANPQIKLIIPEANRAFVAGRLKIDAAIPLGMDAGLTFSESGFSITAIPAAHEKFDRDAQGRHPYLGYVIRFGDWSLYHSGDTILYDGMAARLTRFKIDIALLPINGARPERRVAGNLDGREAAQLAKDIGARCVIPCHYDMFEFNTARPEDEFIRVCKALKQRFRVLRTGERFESTELETS
ncbi:MAG TPA: MBL fold metallo-hydrolase [Planctomycetota bacterium]|nr:MBL fold metallo-hydrolase [Planctomycetota bacterium]